MKLTLLGTGNAMVTRCYNTCFIIEDQGRCLLVDGGGGSTILGRIREAGYEWKDIHHIYVTHKHVDHIMGVVWMVRAFSSGTTFSQSGISGYRRTTWLMATPFVSGIRHLLTSSPQSSLKWHHLSLWGKFMMLLMAIAMSFSWKRVVVGAGL